MPVSAPTTAHAPANYEIFFELGRGGMGSAYLARNVGPDGFGRLVVIKRLLAERLHDGNAVRRFVDEANVTASIHHTNVVGIQHVGHDEYGHFLVLDYVEGGSLEELVDRAALRGERIPPPIVLRIALDALAGLEAIHQSRDVYGKPLGILHRDISLQNILVGRDGATRITDFGIAKSAVNSASTDQKYILGKLLYLAPEYLKGRSSGPPLDVYALGVTVWQALTGEQPWEGETEAQLIYRIVQEGLPPLSQHMQIAPKIEQIIARACHLESSLRYQTAEHMARGIENLGLETGWIATRSEVQRWLLQLMEADLHKRRQRVAKIIDASSASRFTGLEGTTNGGFVSETSTREQPRVRQNSRVLPVALAMSLVLAVGVVVLAFGRDAEPTPSPVASSSARPAVAASSAPRPPDPAPEPAVTVALPTVPPPSSEPSETAAPQRTSSQKHKWTSSPVTKRREPAQPPEPRVSKPPSSRTAAPTPPQLHAPDDISERNPYR